MLNFNKFLFAFFYITPLFAADQSLTQLFKQYDERLLALEKKSNSHKGVINLRSSDTTMILGGRVQLDTIYLGPASGKSGGSNSSDNFFNANNIPLKDQDEIDELVLFARNSKFWVKTRTDTDDTKPLMTLLEVDFWGSDANEKNTNSYGIRLRHAYFEYMGWTIGQTNSAFTGKAKPSTLRAPVNDVLIRQPVIRYTHTFNKNALSISIEQPESVLMMPTGEIITVNDDRLPDVIFDFYRYERFGEFSLSILLRNLRIVNEQDLQIEDTTWGYGIHFSQKIKTFGNDDIRLSLIGGRGIGRYFATSFFPSAVIDHDNTLKAQLAWGGHLSYQHWWNRNLKSNIAYGMIETDNQLPLETINKAASSFHIDLQYTPIKNLMLACEYIHGSREQESGETNDVDRLYFQASYDF